VPLFHHLPFERRREDERLLRNCTTSRKEQYWYDPSRPLHTELLYVKLLSQQGPRHRYELGSGGVTQRHRRSGLGIHRVGSAMSMAIWAGPPRIDCETP
jgi:hypothetical protein